MDDRCLVEGTQYMLTIVTHCYCYNYSNSCLGKRMFSHILKFLSEINLFIRYYLYPKAELDHKSYTGIYKRLVEKDWLLNRSQGLGGTHLLKGTESRV